jgi:hypothetical protein
MLMRKAPALGWEGAQGRARGGRAAGRAEGVGGGPTRSERARTHSEHPEAYLRLAPARLRRASRRLQPRHLRLRPGLLGFPLSSPPHPFSAPLLGCALAGSLSPFCLELNPGGKQVGVRKARNR